jgi:mono/diheme cytochrome c family protein
MRILVAVLMGVVVLFGVACGGPETVPPAPTPTSVDRIAAGGQLFIDKGCVACHGQNAEGTDIAPALPGHNAEQTKRQVRSPRGTMPRFSPESISDDELGMIAAYIKSLTPAEEHIEPVAMENALVVHHWMALSALEADNLDEAEHHVRHILELVTDPEHKAQMEDVIEDMLAGNHHDASHAIEEMLAGKADPELFLKNLHLQLALGAFVTENLEDAKHHLEHFIDMATGDERVRGEEAIDLLEQGNIRDAEH